jgi:hypothetical protein
MWMLKMENMFNHRNNPIFHRAAFPNMVQSWGIKPIISIDCGSSPGMSGVRTAIFKYLQGLKLSATLRAFWRLYGVANSVPRRLAMAVSRSVIPPASCDTRPSRTRLYRISMSGWCPAASAAAATRFTNAIAATKSLKAHSLTSLPSFKFHSGLAVRKLSISTAVSALFMDITSRQRC